MRFYDQGVLIQHLEDFQQYLQESERRDRDRAKQKRLAGQRSLLGEWL